MPVSLLLAHFLDQQAQLKENLENAIWPQPHSSQGRVGRGTREKGEEYVRQPQSQGKFKINLSCDNVLTDWLLERYGARRLCRNSQNQRE